jgi:hypothetical protein
MFKRLKMLLVLLAALAMALMWSVPATADPAPSAEDCLATPTLEGCLPGGENDGETSDPPSDPVGPPQTKKADDPASTGAAARAAEAAAVPGADDLVPEVPLCDSDPTTAPLPCPTLPGSPGAPLSCDDLAELLELPGCPESFTCEDLAELFGVSDCPEGPPTCEDLAELFGLEGCPEAPADCDDFAELLGVPGCSSIPCIDTSQLPDSSQAPGLRELLAALEEIGIESCAEEAGGGTATPTPIKPPTQNAQPPAVYYANCDDARAKGAAPVYAHQAGYRPELDSDHDGIGCEETAAPVVTPTAYTGGGKLAYTGVTVEPLVAWGSALLLSGGWLILSGRRRA